jgi:hypothetical protein
MGGSSSSEKGAEDHSESGGVETKRTVCTTITGGKSRKNRKHRNHCTLIQKVNSQKDILCADSYIRIYINLILYEFV